jgi:sigma-B regulation protein RsbU (phosphoserine phosphatase)
VRGDFYDFVPLHEGREAVVLGDVCGIGPLAANDAALARYSLRSLAGEVTDPAELMRRMNAIVYEQSDFERFARLLLAVIEPERAALTYVSAGHVPPVLYRSTSGTVEWLSEGGPALGIEDDVEYKQTQVVLEPGDMLLLYTDGVTEGTRNDRVFGQRKLGDLVERYGVGTPGELVQAVRRAVEAWAPAGGLRDDVAMVVCQVVADAAIGELTRELVLPNEAVRIAEVRAFVSSFCADLRAPVVASQELVLAVSEAAANATRYARNDQGSSEIRIRCAREAGDVVVVVADDGPGLDPLRARSRDLPDRFASGGRGLFLMHQFTDSVDVESTRHGTSVRLRRRLFD